MTLLVVSLLAAVLEVEAAPSFIDHGKTCERSFKTLLLTNGSDAEVKLVGAESTNSSFPVPPAGSVVPAKGSSTLKLGFEPSGEALYFGKHTLTFAWSEAAIEAERRRLDESVGRQARRFRESANNLRIRGVDDTAVRLLESEAEQTWRQARAAAQHDAWTAYNALLAERDQVLRELREGFFCSKCMKSQTQLGGPQSFAQHLAAVQGERVPAPPEEIERTKKEYDVRLEQEAGRARQREASVARLDLTYNARRQELSRRREQLIQLHSSTIASFEENARALDGRMAKELAAFREERTRVVVPQTAECRSKPPPEKKRYAYEATGLVGICSGVEFSFVLQSEPGMTVEKVTLIARNTNDFPVHLTFTAFFERDGGARVTAAMEGGKVNAGRTTERVHAPFDSELGREEPVPVMAWGVDSIRVTDVDKTLAITPPATYAQMGAGPFITECPGFSAGVPRRKVER